MQHNTAPMPLTKEDNLSNQERSVLEELLDTQKMEELLESQEALHSCNNSNNATQTMTPFDKFQDSLIAASKYVSVGFRTLDLLFGDLDLDRVMESWFDICEASPLLHGDARDAYAVWELKCDNNFAFFIMCAYVAITAYGEERFNALMEQSGEAE